VKNRIIDIPTDLTLQAALFAKTAVIATIEAGKEGIAHR
jgi:hypothetical protein